jgi:hypothetical protein
MIPVSDVPPDVLREYGPWALCETSLEIFVVLFNQEGLAGVETLLQQPVGFTKEGLRRDADVLGKIGMRPLAALLRQHARRAKPARSTFKTRWARQIAAAEKAATR